MNKIIVKVLIILSGILILVLCFFLLKKKEETDKLSTLRVGYFLNITHPQAVLGLNRSDFDNIFSDIKIDKKVFNAGPQAVQAFMAGELDIGYMGPGPALNAFSKSQGEILIIAGACEGGTLFIIQTDSSIKTLQDLSGKKIATPQLSNTQDLLLHHLLSKIGLNDTLHGGNVDVINISSSAIFTLFQQKEVEAALIPEPWGTRLVEEANARIFMDEKDVYRNGDYPVTVLVTRKTFLIKHPDIIKKWLKKHIELTDEILNDFTPVKKSFLIELKKISGNNILLSEKILDKAFKRTKPSYKLNIDAMQDFANILFNGSYVRTPINLNEAVDLTLLKEVSKI
ncbi:MAG: aliphatic sulfonate ABC transporter substrate-binding protein [Candidatus Firestonebacteria bacterium]|nr:aliphatic sulfonate ABC transporter substrate-binding protein [Candidatus Firestonebacteria bacterium]